MLILLLALPRDAHAACDHHAGMREPSPRTELRRFLFALAFFLLCLAVVVALGFGVGVYH